ncbi:glycoside hydrolase family 95 protein [Rhodanobacter caeni]|uniref:Glycoside hydrolase family 95 protein n=1 Tax=Rhodanobacter caeni TaxID=657654 RepID=A0ABP3EIL2_9GAMM
MSMPNPPARRRGKAHVYVMLTAVASVLGLFSGASFAAQNLQLHYDAPATTFNEALPLGNGRMGAMVYGGVQHARYSLSEISMFSGSRYDGADRKDAFAYLPQIRQLLREGRNVEAEQLTNQHFTWSGEAASAHYGSYQGLGTLTLDFAANAAPVIGYRRSLDIPTATSEVRYTQDGVNYRRTMFASAPDQVMVLHLSADRAGALNFVARLHRAERATVEVDGVNGLLMRGALDSGGSGKGLAFAARVRVIAPGASVHADAHCLRVEHGTDVTVLISEATDYDGFAGRHTADPVAASAADLRRVAGRSVAQLHAAHVADFRSWFDRFSLQLGSANSAREAMSTRSRLAAYGAGGDPGFAALYFQYARYLLISSSRPGGLPANLQGLWAEGTSTPWNGDYHTNVNIEMNYWPAEPTGLGELAQPLFALTASLQQPGAKTAQRYYGARGWVVHTLTNLWGFTAPGAEASWGVWQGAPAWLGFHIWDHYRYSGDRDFLRRYYPVLRGAAQFYADVLIEEPGYHWLVTAPSSSPENTVYMDDGRKAAIVMGPTMDEELIRFLFGAVIEASQTLQVDADFRRELEAKRARLAPIQISPDGRIQEYLKPYREVEVHHRHVSHLWALFPGDQIDLAETPKLAAAAARSLDVRGDDSTGWSEAYKVNLWAHLGDGNRALHLLNVLFKPASRDTRLGHEWAGTYPNLFNAGPPFQIDGNFGATSGMVEMLMQSEVGQIHLLPALPDAWPQGDVRGLHARGGFVVDMRWAKGKLVEASLRSLRGGDCVVRYGERQVSLSTKAGRTYRLQSRDFL